MSNYTKATNFATKDTLPSGNSGKIVKGTELDDEFNAISSAVASKADTASPTFTGTPAAPTAAALTNTTQIATTAFVQAALEVLYPVGSVYMNATSSSNPATLLGFGTWTAFGAGRVPVGYDSTNSNFNSAEKTGGSADAVVVSHTHSVTDPGHTHSYTNPQSPSSGSNSYQNGPQGYTWRAENIASGTTASKTTGISLGSTGSSGTNANLQPYITVYMWKRTA